MVPQLFTRTSAASSAQISIPEPRDNRRHATEAISSCRLLEITHPNGMAAHFVDGLKTDLVGRIVAHEDRRTPGELALPHEHLDGASLIETTRHKLGNALARTHDELVAEFRNHFVHHDFDFRRELGS